MLFEGLCLVSECGIFNQDQSGLRQQCSDTILTEKNPAAAIELSDSQALVLKSVLFYWKMGEMLLFHLEDIQT